MEDICETLMMLFSISMKFISLFPFFSEPSAAPLFGLIGEIFDEQWRVQFDFVVGWIIDPQVEYHIHFESFFGIFEIVCEFVAFVSGDFTNRFSIDEELDAVAAPDTFVFDEVMYWILEDIEDALVFRTNVAMV